MSLTLQFNVAGSWRNVLTISQAECDAPGILDKIVNAAWVLLSAAGLDHASLRMLDDEKRVVLIWDRGGRKDWPYGRST